MAARGTPIGGWWASFPYHGEEYARRFNSREDAVAYIPLVKTKEGKRPPLGRKLVMQVVWDYDNNRWTHHDVVEYSQHEVEAMFIAQGEVNGAAA